MLIPEAELIQGRLKSLKEQWQACYRCPLGSRTSTRILWEFDDQSGRIETGKANTTISETVDVLFIGEGPGAAEDTFGRPFVGRAGRLLRGAIKAASPQGVSIAYSNLVACRPTDGQGNRPPTEFEIGSCAERLVGLIAAIDPYAIVCTALVPQKYFEEFRRSILDWQGVYVKIAHPAALLRRGGEKASDYNDYILTLKGLFERIRKERDECQKQIQDKLEKNIDTN